MSRRLTLKEFVCKSRLIHGDKYDYSHVDYKGIEVKVKIVCNKCGNVFEQTPHSHLNGRGCPVCGKQTTRDKLLLGKDVFVEKARKVHNNFYDYSKVKYINNKTKVCVICPKHGEFWQTPYNHIGQKQGCPQCGLVKQGENQARTTEEFIRLATKKHNGRYSYPRTIYTRSNQKVIITCNKHGDFEQEANAHLMGCGCPKCGIEQRNDKATKTTEEFVEQVKKVHGERFMFNNTVYHGHHSKVCVTCREHGDVLVYANSLLNGGGCPICAKISVSKQLASTKEIFVKQAEIVHGNTYDYSKVVYVNNRTFIEIVCKKHGSYWQSPHMHLRGNGCPKCKRSLGEEKVELFLTRNNYKYIPQYIIANDNLFCENKNIIVDFCLPENNTIIEFHGEQHYRAVDLFGGEKQFVKQQERDFALRSYCERNKINLIEIPYTEINEIDNILQIKLKH